MARRPTAGLIAALVLVTVVACAARSEPASPASPDASGKLAPSLAQRLPSLPPDQPVRLVALLAPGTGTGALRSDVEALGGQVIQRFTLIEGAEVSVPGRQVLALARLPEIRRLELSDSGVPPPQPSGPAGTPSASGPPGTGTTTGDSRSR